MDRSQLAVFAGIIQNSAAGNFPGKTWFGAENRKKTSQIIMTTFTYCCLFYEKYRPD
jgi:hypothetical protein